MERREICEKVEHNVDESAIACALLLAAEFLFCSPTSPTIILKKNLRFLGFFDSLYNNNGGITKEIKQNFFM